MRFSVQHSPLVRLGLAAILLACGHTQAGAQLSHDVPKASTKEDLAQEFEKAYESFSAQQAYDALFKDFAADTAAAAQASGKQPPRELAKLQEALQYLLGVRSTRPNGLDEQTLQLAKLALFQAYLNQQAAGGDPLLVKSVLAGMDRVDKELRTEEAHKGSMDAVEWGREKEELQKSMGRDDQTGNPSEAERILQLLFGRERKNSRAALNQLLDKTHLTEEETRKVEVIKETQKVADAIRYLLGDVTKQVTDREVLQTAVNALDLKMKIANLDPETSEAVQRALSKGKAGLQVLDAAAAAKDFAGRASGAIGDAGVWDAFSSIGRTVGKIAAGFTEGLGLTKRDPETGEAKPTAVGTVAGQFAEAVGNVLVPNAATAARVAAANLAETPKEEADRETAGRTAADAAGGPTLAGAGTQARANNLLQAFLDPHGYAENVGRDAMDAEYMSPREIEPGQRAGDATRPGPAQGNPAPEGRMETKPATDLAGGATSAMPTTSSTSGSTTASTGSVSRTGTGSGSSGVGSYAGTGPSLSEATRRAQSQVYANQNATNSANPAFGIAKGPDAPTTERAPAVGTAAAVGSIADTSAATAKTAETQTEAAAKAPTPVKLAQATQSGTTQASGPVFYPVGVPIPQPVTPPSGSTTGSTPFEPTKTDTDEMRRSESSYPEDSVVVPKYVARNGKEMIRVVKTEAGKQAEVAANVATENTPTYSPSYEPQEAAVEIQPTREPRTLASITPSSMKPIVVEKVRQAKDFIDGIVSSASNWVNEATASDDTTEAEPVDALAAAQVLLSQMKQMAKTQMKTGEGTVSIAEPYNAPSAARAAGMPAIPATKAFAVESGSSDITAFLKRKDKI